MQSAFIVAGNWKMNLGLTASIQLANSIKAGLPTKLTTEVWLAPSANTLQQVCASVKGSTIQVGAQNVHWAESGAFTGELSVQMLIESGCSFAIVGHSERRHVFGEDNQQVVKRALAGLKQKFKIILCVGETLHEREQNLTNAILEEQLAGVLAELDAQMAEHLVIAYEPVWAIGTGKVASLDQIQAAHSFIKDQLKLVKPGIQNSIPVLYGGSVNTENFADIARLEQVNGALVGGASLQADKFLSLIDIL